jgi:hypothetical protein
MLIYTRLHGRPRATTYSGLDACWCLITHVLVSCEMVKWEWSSWQQSVETDDDVISMWSVFTSRNERQVVKRLRSASVISIFGSFVISFLWAFDLQHLTFLQADRPLSEYYYTEGVRVNAARRWQLLACYIFHTDSLDSLFASVSK